MKEKKEKNMQLNNKLKKKKKESRDGLLDEWLLFFHVVYYIHGTGLPILLDMGSVRLSVSYQIC